MKSYNITTNQWFLLLVPIATQVQSIDPEIKPTDNYAAQ